MKPSQENVNYQKLRKEAEKVTSATSTAGNKHKKTTSMEVDPHSEDMLPLLSDDEDNTESTKDSAKKLKLATKNPSDKPCKC